MLAGLIILAVSVITPNTVSREIKRVGAEATLKSIYDDKANWYRLLDGVATGSRDWLLLANQLKAASDAGASVQLSLAVGQALEHLPENVLRLSVRAFELEDICGGPDVDDARYDSYEKSIRAIELRISKVKQVHAKTLRAKRDRCVKSLIESRAGIAAFYGRTPPSRRR